MARIDFYTLDKQEKIAIFSAIASEKGMTPFAVEKDWWVCCTLHVIFQLDISKHLVFKGGTSLSKAWKLIHRFSEDIDLAIDQAFFDGYTSNLSRTQINQLRKEAGEYTTGVLFFDLQEAFRRAGYHDLNYRVIASSESDRDPRIIEVYYPNIISPPSTYVLPKVQIEIGCRSLKEPFTFRPLSSLVDEQYPDQYFADNPFDVPTVNPERTLLEKLFLLHEEVQRPIEKMRVNRLSRHLYDIYHLHQAGVSEAAINNKQLYQTVVAHRYKFSRVGGVDYNTHHPHRLNPIPISDRIADWRADYQRMLEEMIYDDNKPSFEQLIENLQHLIGLLQRVAWDFDLVFPTRNK